MAVFTGNWNAYRYVGRKPWYAFTTVDGSGSAERFGYQTTNQTATVAPMPTTKRRASRAAKT